MAITITTFIVGISFALVRLRVFDAVLEQSIQFPVLFVSLQSTFDLLWNLFIRYRLVAIKDLAPVALPRASDFEKNTLELVLEQYLRFLFAPTPFIAFFDCVRKRCPIAGSKSDIYVEYSLTHRLQVLVSSFGSFFTLFAPLVFTGVILSSAILFGSIQKITFVPFWLVFLSAQLSVAGLIQTVCLLKFLPKSRQSHQGAGQISGQNSGSTAVASGYISPSGILRSQWKRWCDSRLISVDHKKELERNLAVFSLGWGKVTSESVYAFSMGNSVSATVSELVPVGRVRAKLFFKNYRQLVIVPVFPGTGCNLFLVGDFNKFAQINFNSLPSAFYCKSPSLVNYAFVDCERNSTRLIFFN